MRPSYAFFLSGANLRQRKLRSLLTIGGMAVGVALIVFLVSLGFGLQKLIHDKITNVEALSVLEVSIGNSALLQINQSTIDALQSLQNVEAVSPSISMSGQVLIENTATDVAVYGISPAFISLEGVTIASGKDFSGTDAKEVIMTSGALSLLGVSIPTNTLDKNITLRLSLPTAETATSPNLQDMEVKVVGIISDDKLVAAYVPIGFLQSLGFPASYSDAKVKVSPDQLKQYNLARVKVENQSKLPEVRREIEKMGYQVDSIADTIGQVDSIFLVFQLVVSIFGLIAMFVAALGALNTLTVSLLERTREIGLLKALGASSSDIYQLFFAESMALGVSGGLLGVALGIGAGAAVNSGLQYLARRLGGTVVSVFLTPWWFILGILGLVMFVSFITGYYPARRAAKMLPLQELKHE